MPDFALPSWLAVIVFVAVVLAGHRFRKVWKEQPPGWQKRAWVFGSIAFVGLLVLGFVPLRS
jgi:hypothetical protein